MVDLSIIIVNWNTREFLKNCLRSIYRTTRNMKFEIIVVDNASSDGSAEMVEKEFPGTRLIKNKENRGFAFANNQGIKVAQGEFVLLLNSDTIILDNAIEESMNFMRRYKKAGAMGCKLLNQNGSLQPSCHRFISLGGAVLHKIGILKLLPRQYRAKFESPIVSWNNDEIKEVDYVKGAFLLLSASAIRKIGLLDEQFFMYAEEADLCLRLRRSGLKVYFYPFAKIIHLKGQSSQSVGSVMEVQMIVSRVRFLKKHHSLMYYLGYRYASLLLHLLKTLIYNLSHGRHAEETEISRAKVNVLLKMRFRRDAVLFLLHLIFFVWRYPSLT